MKSIEAKQPETAHDIHHLIAKRWSARAFSDRPISEEVVKSLFEAARWAPSAFNEQPWQYVYAHHGTEGFKKLLSCLSSGNQVWADSAAVLFVSLQRKYFNNNGKENPWACHDLGLANAQLLLQAVHYDIYGHLMAGFDKSMIKSALDLNLKSEPLCMGALGYLAKAEELPEPYKSRELSERNRQPQEDFVFKLS